MPLPIAITFEMTDVVAAQATRENWIAQGRRLFSPSLLLLSAVSTAIFVYSLRKPSPWLWLVLTAAAPVLLLVMVIFWWGTLWWGPRAAQQKLVRLTHRNVTIQLHDSDLVIITANERMELKWIEVRELRELSHFFVIAFATGAEIPLPREAVSIEAEEFLRGKVAANSRDGAAVPRA